MPSFMAASKFPFSAALEHGRHKASRDFTPFPHSTSRLTPTSHEDSDGDTGSWTEAVRDPAPCCATPPEGSRTVKSLGEKAQCWLGWSQRSVNVFCGYAETTESYTFNKLHSVGIALLSSLTGPGKGCGHAPDPCAYRSEAPASSLASPLARAEQCSGFSK